ncbi:lysophospholipid acyltransferase family protein [Tessaracoccus antarcticus]|uniref:1-acyl-sn-glycerol-3-phosphate acyltransferase n=1 Tax=Tessaracoccus antarcticus TaxID=2479848 RepID=A0A3M0GNS0_9ACTN|nr:lysophospholipid acyltransferase family protein [Tessaracoccus antarcticus]RMB58936.1 1-acyl-sn-glycerol-3-phosphate acyltransferase [Tessaracoccus antarcticus]
MHEMSRPDADKPWRLPLRKVNTEKAPWVYRALVRAVRLVAPLLTRRHWSRQDLIPPDGGVLVVANHISNYDVLVLGEFLIWSGRWPRFLGKSEIFSAPVLGWVAHQCGQIPVLRNTKDAKQSLVFAKKALQDGQMVAMYPEGTITKDPDGWPMSGRRGAAMLALSTGVPVVPVGQIGAEEVLGGPTIQWGKLFSLRRRPVHVLAGEPVDLDRFRREGQDPSPETLELATVAIMDAVAALVEQLRDEQAPRGRWDMRVGARVPQKR